MLGKIKVERVEEHRPGPWTEAEAAGNRQAAAIAPAAQAAWAREAAAATVSAIEAFRQARVVHQGAVALLAAPQAGAEAVRGRAVHAALPVWDPVEAEDPAVAAGAVGKSIDPSTIKE